VDEAPRASFEKTLVDEQVKLANSSGLRTWGPAVWLGVLLVFRVVADSPLVRVFLALAVPYALYALAVGIARRVLVRPMRLLYTTPFVDIPFAGVVCFEWAKVKGQSADLPCAMAVAMCLFFVTTAAVHANQRTLAACMMTSALVVVALFTHFHEPTAALALALLLVAMTGGAGRIIIRTNHTQVRKAFELAEARVKEVEDRNREVNALNDELRRQVAERSRELTEALARSEGSVAPAALDVGDVFDGRYRVTRALGRGGMGAVYEVERSRDAKRLALKVVTGAMSAKHAARFAREAEIGARLQHENLVSIVDVGIAAGVTPFLVMELVQGSSLEDKRARFGDAAWARPIVRQVAAGLAELHANRVVHRDLKPGNVLLVENGGSSPPLAKISDFGISRFGALDDSGDATAHPGAAHASPRDLTETGALMGTPVYMPPEAWFGPARHPSADVFSLGVLAYEALTGRSPFAVPPVLLVRARQPIPAPAPLDGVDATVASLVLTCLRVEPAERPRAKEIAEALA